MTIVRFGESQFDAGLVAFDKDGTLIDFEFMWGRLAQAWVHHLETGIEGHCPATARLAYYKSALRHDLFRSWGYDPVRKRTRAMSPLAIASTGQLQTIAAVTLYRRGIPWPEAEDRASAAIRSTQARADLALSALVRPTGDVGRLVRRLKDAGVRVAVVTTDHRAETEETLRLLGIDALVDATVCGDDGLAIKPAPDMLLAACEKCGVEPARTAVVGDTEGDLLMAARAGAGLKVAVLTGPGDPEFLRKHADMVITSVDDIEIASAGPGSPDAGAQSAMITIQGGFPND